MSLFRNSLRPPAVLSDEAVERYLAAVRAQVDPDPAFRRRLRGIVLNQYVAARESGRAGSAPKAMGRLGRTVLYASFLLGVSVTGVMAASDVAVPGDPLYPIKRGIEDLRVQVLPDEFTEELLIAELNERFSELAVLAERDDVDRVQALAEEFATEYASVIVVAGTDGQPLDRRTEVLTSLMARLPDEARDALDHALGAPSAGGPGGAAPGTGSDGAVPAAPAAGSGGDTLTGDVDDSDQATGGGGGNGRANGGANGNGQGGANGAANGDANGQGAGTGAGQGGGTSESDDASAPPEPTPTPEPSPKPKPSKPPKP